MQSNYTLNKKFTHNSNDLTLWGTTSKELFKVGEKELGGLGLAELLLKLFLLFETNT